MPKVIGSASGNNLKITIPERGEKNWDELIENSCFTPISNHSHTGNGDGAKIDTDALEDNAVTTAKIADANVTEAKLDSATQTKLAQISTNTSNIQQNATDIANVQAGAIPDGSVTTAKLANGAVTAAKIGSDVVLSTLNDVSSATPSAGQVLKWDGVANEWVPGTDSGGSGGSGVDVVSSAADAANYTGTSRIIHITATENVTFTTDLTNKIIFWDQPYKLTFSNANLLNCSLFLGNDASYTGLRFENTSTDGSTDVEIRNCSIRCWADMEIDLSGNTVGNKINFFMCKIEAGDIDILNANNSFVTLYSCVTHAVILDSSTSSNAIPVSISSGKFDARFLKGVVYTSNAQLNVTQGSYGSSNITIKSSGTTIFGPAIFEHPFKVIAGKFIPEGHTVASITAPAHSAVTTTTNIPNLSIESNESSACAPSLFSIGNAFGATNNAINFVKAGKYKVELWIGGGYSAATYIPSGTSTIIYGTTTGTNLPSFSTIFYDGSSNTTIAYGRPGPHNSGITTTSMSTTFEITNPSTQFIYFQMDDVQLYRFKVKITLIE